MIRVSKILTLSLVSTVSVGSVGLVPTLCLTASNQQNPILEEKVTQDWMLDIDANGVLHGFNQNAIDPEDPKPEPFAIDDMYLRVNGYTKLVIPSAVKEIAPYAFAYRFDDQLNHITSIDFTNATNLESIGDNAFNYCYAVESNIDLSHSPNLKYIGDSAFYYCTGIKNLVLSSTSTADLVIGDHSFYKCSSLKTLDLYKNIKDIKNNAFDQCVRLEEINLLNFSTFPSWMLSSTWIFNGVGNKTAEECTFKAPYMGLSTDRWKEILHVTQMLPEKWNISYFHPTTKDNFTYDSEGAITGLIGDPTTFDALVIPDNVTKICDNAFKNKFVALHIPLILHNKIEYIGNSAFEGNEGLESNLELPVYLKTLGNSAFKNCINLTGNITIPSGIKSLNSNVFESTGINGITFHAGVESVQARAVANCTNLSWIDVSAFHYGNPDWRAQTEANQQPFYGVCDNGGILLYDYASSHDMIKEWWSAKLSELGMQGKVNKDGIDLKQWTFHFNDDKHSLALPPEAYNTINNFDLRGLKNKYSSVDVLSKYGQFRIPDRIASIGASAFKEKFVDPSIKAKLILNEGLKTINASAFEGNTSLYGDLIIPQTTSVIDNYAFRNCSNLQGTVALPQSLTKVGIDPFEGTNFTSISLPRDLRTIQFANYAIKTNSSLKVIDLRKSVLPQTSPYQPWIKFTSGTSGKILVQTESMRVLFQEYFNVLNTQFPDVGYDPAKWVITVVGA